MAATAMAGAVAVKSMSLFGSAAYYVVQSFSSLSSATVGILFGHSVVAMFDEFLNVCVKVTSLVSDLMQFLEDLTKSYKQLAEEAKPRLNGIEENYADAVQLAQRIQRGCLKPANVDERSFCIEKQMEAYDKISNLRKERRKANERYLYYKGRADWWDGVWPSN